MDHQRELDEQLYSAIFLNDEPWVDFELAESLIKRGANVNAKNEKGHPLIIEALLENTATSHCRNVIELLLRYGADPNTCCPEGENVLYLAAKNNNGQDNSNDRSYLDILKLLLAHGARMLHDTPEVWFKPFEAVLENGSIDAVRLFLNHGLGLQKCNVSFPLHCATRNKHTRILEYLLIKNCFSIDAKDSDGLTPLHEALYNKSLEHVKLLLAYKASVNLPNGFEDTPLSTAVQNGDLDCVKMLLTFDADPNVDFPYSKGRIPLCVSVRENAIECVEVLLENGCKLGFRGSMFLLEIKDQIEARTIKALMRHVALLESQLKFVEQGYYKLFTGKYEIQNNKYLVDCKTEIERLRSSVVHGSTTFYEFLTKKVMCSNTRLTSDYVNSVLESDVMEKTFPIYGERLKTRFREAKELLNLKKKAIRGLGRILPFDVQTFHIVANRILNCLKNKDLICLTLT